QVITDVGRNTGIGTCEGGGGNAGLPASAIGFRFAELLRLLNAEFQFTNGVEVFVELVGITAANLATQTLGFGKHGVEHALVSTTLGAIVKQHVERLLGIDLLRSRSGRAAP